MTKKVLFLFTLLILNYSNVVLSQKKVSTTKHLSQNFNKYTLKIKWLDSTPNTTYLLINSGKKLILKDTCSLNQSNTCTFYLPKSKYLKGLYTIIKPAPNNQRQNDIYSSVILDADSIIDLNIQSNGEIRVKQSNDNKIFTDFLNDMNVLYRYAQLSNQKYNETQNNSPENKNKLLDSVKYYDNLIISTINHYSLKYPDHILVILNNLQQIINNFQNPIIEAEIKKMNVEDFFKSLQLNDERTLRTPQIYDIIDIYTTKFVEQNPDSIYQKVIKNVLQLIHPNNFKDILVYFSEKYGLERIPFQNAEKILIYLYDNYISSKNAIFENNFYYFVKNKVESFKRLLNGSFAPNFELLDTSGKMISLYSIQKKYTLLAFWDTHCVHCKKAIPIIDQQVNKNLNEFDIQMVGITTDGSKEDLAAFCKEKSLSNWVHLLDDKKFRDEQAAKGILNYRYLYGISQTPTFFLLDKDKKIIAKYFTPNELSQFVK